MTDSQGEIRNVILLSHYGAGKTSLAEAMLFTAGAIKRLGSVNDGTTTSDYDLSEIERHMSINLSILSYEWKGTKQNIIDTPGYADFVGEVKAGLRISDAAVVVICAASGVEVGTEQVWACAKELNLPCLIFVNKMDRDNADFLRTLEQIQTKLSSKCLPLQLPLGSQKEFRGIVDLLTMESSAEIGPSLSQQAKSYRERLVESAIESDDELIAKYLEGEQLSSDEIHQAIRKSIMDGKLVPVLAGSALHNVGIDSLLKAIDNYLPSPEEKDTIITADAPLSCLVFKTSADPYVGKLSYFRVYSGIISSNSQIWNANKSAMEHVGQLFTLLGKNQQPVPQLSAGEIGAVAKLSLTTTSDTLCVREHPIMLNGIKFPQANFSLAVEPQTKDDLDKMSTTLPRICEEDPSLQLRRDADTNQVIISGIGDSHLEIVKERMHHKFGVAVKLEPPRIPYKETITIATKAEYKHKKQTGGHGQYGHVFLELEPLSRDSGFEFKKRIVGGAIPKNYIPAVEKGINEARQEGILAGYQVVDTKVTLYDGSFHPVDSSDIAFKIAAAHALRKGLSQAGSVLLEPIMRLTITAPEAYTGDIISDLNAKRGRVLGMTPKEGVNVINALAPHAELLRYAIDLRSMTQGRGNFIMNFDHYEEVPSHLSQAIIEARKKELSKE